MANFKTKHYKTFSFPNPFSSIEQYYCYLNEFDFIPKVMPPQIIKNIFDAATRDYLEGYLQFDEYAVIFERIYYNFAKGQAGLNKDMKNLMDDMASYLEDEPIDRIEWERKAREYLSS